MESKNIEFIETEQNNGCQSRGKEGGENREKLIKGSKLSVIIQIGSEDSMVILINNIVLCT